jgi:hypothetical protein
VSNTREKIVSNIVSTYNITAIKEAGDAKVCILDLQITGSNGAPVLVSVNFYDKRVPRPFGTLNTSPTGFTFITVSLPEKDLNHYMKVLHSKMQVSADWSATKKGKLTYFKLMAFGVSPT